MRPEVKQELERIRKQCGGTLYPEAVVKAAKKKTSPIHDWFTWDDSEAAHNYRLWQARNLIKVAVTVVDNSDKPVRTYVSLEEDRGTAESYRHIDDVMADPVNRERLLSQAFRELDSWQKRYKQLQELADIFEAAENAKQKRKAA